MIRMIMRMRQTLAGIDNDYLVISNQIYVFSGRIFN